MNYQVDQKFTYSKLILRKDLYRQIWDDAGLWPGEASPNRRPPLQRRPTPPQPRDFPKEEPTR